MPYLSQANQLNQFLKQFNGISATRCVFLQTDVAPDVSVDIRFYRAWKNI